MEDSPPPLLPPSFSEGFFEKLSFPLFLSFFLSDSPLLFVGRWAAPSEGERQRHAAVEQAADHGNDEYCRRRVEAKQPMAGRIQGMKEVGAALLVLSFSVADTTDTTTIAIE